MFVLFVTSSQDLNIAENTALMLKPKYEIYILWNSLP